MKKKLKKLVKTLVGRFSPSYKEHCPRGGDFTREILQDEFTTWIRFAVAGMLGDGNLVASAWAMERLPAEGDIIEIGSFCGLSTIMLSHLRGRFGESGRRIITADKWEFEGQELGKNLGSSQVKHDTYREFVRESYLRNVRTFCHPPPATVEAFSDEFFSFWSEAETKVDVVSGEPIQLGGPIAFAYIDGNHTYDFAKRDFENTDRHLVSGGWIMFDDSADGSGWEVNQLVKEIAKRNDYELVAQAPNYLFRKV